MLRPLIISLLVLAVSNAYADMLDQGEVDFFSTKEPASACHSCQDASADVDKYAAKIQSGDSRNDGAISVYAVIDPACRSCRDTVRQLAAVKKVHPEWEYQGYILSSFEEIEEVVAPRAPMFEESGEIAYAFDFDGSVTERFAIDVVPTFVIRHNGMFYKVSGQPDLLAIIEEISS